MGQSIDFLNDRIGPLIYKTFIPGLLATSVSIITQVANTFFMGHDEPVSLYVIGLFMPLSFFTTAIMEGFSASTSAAVAVEKGGGNEENIRKVIGNFAFNGTIVSLAVAIIVSLSIPLFVNYFYVHPSAQDTFVTFTRLMVFTNILVVLDGIIWAGIRGYGLVNLSAAVNIILAFGVIGFVFLFVQFFHMGVYSLILANIIVIGPALIVGLFVMAKYNIMAIKIRKINFSSLLKMHPIVKQRLMNTGIPVMLSYIIIFFATFFYNKIISPFGEDVVAGFGAAYRVQTIVLAFAFSFGGAVALIMNQNIGGSKFDRSYKTFKKGLMHIFGIYIVIGSFIFLANHKIATFLIEDTDTAQHTTTFLKIVGLSFIIMGPMMMTLLVLEQIGKGVLAFLLNVLYFTVIVLVGWIVTRKYDQVELFYWTICFMNVFAIVGIGYGFMIIKKLMNKKLRKFQTLGEEQEVTG
ncbi:MULTISPECIES: MATE family efflux transporter [Fervidibacillus]|uniref:MATE family efflux transporter n=2 Tax=Fervidibacillus TaxID=3033930 RepID=A0A9E8M0T1_9BACI|nr:MULTISPECIES: MATE family efflux transporter [Fervidibacillus]WAA08954.1 MATE family efflux transporter [Fervidibacillus albus]WAA12815.1 MATE family efflux transporter [Fervidibacillus halotolerans]